MQVFGHCEIAYLKKRDAKKQETRLRAICEKNIPCIVAARNHQLPGRLLPLVNSMGIPVFQTPMVTMRFLNHATLNMQEEFAPSVSLHGCMVDYRGVGVLLAGPSGSGKSETAIGLLERGAALVADDLVHVRDTGIELIATAPDLARGYLEMRGIGILNAANLFGLSALRPKKRLDLIVVIKPHKDLNKVDRHGLHRKSQDVLGHPVPVIEIPLAPGRDTSRLVAAAALDQQFRSLGYDMADEFNQRLVQHMRKEKEK